MNLLKRFAALLIILSLAAAPLSAFAAANFDDDGNRTEEELPDGAAQDDRPKHELDNPDDAYTEELEYDEYIRLKNEYNETVSKLIALGIWSGEISSEHTQKISAEDFCSVICNLINMNGQGYSRIKALGYDGGKLDLSGGVTLAAAARIMVNALGYGVFAENSGGSDDAYIEVMYRYKISKVSPADADALTMLDAAHMTEDALEAEVYRQIGTKYESSGKDALEYFKGIKSEMGVVRSVGEKTIAKTASPGYIKLGDSLFWTDDEEKYIGLLGCRADAYYTDDSDELLYLGMSDKNNIVTVDGRDITDASSSKIKYKSGEKSGSVTLSAKASEVLNLMQVKPFDSADTDRCDSFTAVDNDGDGRYEVIFISKYDIMLADRVSVRDNKIFGTFNGNEGYTLSVDFDSADTELFDRNMMPVDPSYIISNSVLSVAKHEEKTRIIVSNLAKSAAVTEISSGGYESGEVVCGGLSYSYSTNGDYLGGKIKTGRKYTFYLDYMRRIAGASEESGDEIKYGFLIYAFSDEDNGDDGVKIKMLPYTGETDIFTVSDRAVIDGAARRGADKIMHALSEAAEQCRQEKQAADADYVMQPTAYGSLIYVLEPVAYKTGMNGEINYIDTPYTTQSEYSDGETNIFKRKTMTYYPDFSKKASGQKAGGVFLRNLMAFSNNNGSAVAVDGNTKVFVVPVTDDIDRIRDIDNYAKSGFAYFKDWKSYPETGDQYTQANRIDAYNLNEERVSGIIVYRKALDVSDSIDKTVPLTVVSSVGKALNSLGMEVTRLKGFQGNSEISIDLAEGVSLTKSYTGADGEEILSTVRKGDIIRYTVNSRGELADYVKVFSLRDEDDPEYVKSGNEYGSGADAKSLNKTLLAVSDGKYASNGYDSSHIYDSVGSYGFGASYRVVYGTLVCKNGNNLVIRTSVDTAYGKAQNTEIADFTGFNVLCIDEKADRVYVPSADELISKRGAGEDASKIIMHTDGGKQRQLIIVKREK